MLRITAIPHDHFLTPPKPNVPQIIIPGSLTRQMWEAEYRRRQTERPAIDLLAGQAAPEGRESEDAGLVIDSLDPAADDQARTARELAAFEQELNVFHEQHPREGPWRESLVPFKQRKSQVAVPVVNPPAFRPPPTAKKQAKRGSDPGFVRISWTTPRSSSNDD